MPTVDEFQTQRAYIMWFCGVPDKIIPAGLPGVVTWHTPNGGKRDAFEAKRLKQLGVLAGFPDVAHLWGRLHLVEFKKPGVYRSAEDGLSPAQLELHPRLVAAGAVIATVDDLEDAKKQARAWRLTVDSQQ